MWSNMHDVARAMHFIVLWDKQNGSYSLASKDTIVSFYEGKLCCYFYMPKALHHDSLPLCLTVGIIQANLWHHKMICVAQIESTEKRKDMTAV